jgi:transposase InsO family protein
MDLKIIKSQMRYNRDLEVKKKVILFLSAYRLNNISLACQRLGYHRSFYYFWFRRFSLASFSLEALKPLKRKPRSHPKQTSKEITDLVVSLRRRTNLGPARLQFILKDQYSLYLPISTIAKILKREGLIVPRRGKFRKKHTRRYCMPNPGELIQMDVKYIPYRIKGRQYYQYTALDDCTRFRFAKIYDELSVNNTEAFFKELLRSIPFKIKTIQTDNGVEFTYKFISDPKCIDKPPKEHPLDILCQKHKIYHRLIPPGQCELNGKVERSHRIDEEEFYRLNRYLDLKTLQKAFEEWISSYNCQRPHGGIDMLTPYQKLKLKLKPI